MNTDALDKKLDKKML